MLIAAVAIVLAILCLLCFQVDDWRRDLTTNHAATSRDAEDPTLRSVEIALAPHEVLEQIARFVESHEAWAFSDGPCEDDTSNRSAEHIVRLTHTTQLFRFVDDVQVFLQATDTGTAIDVASASRVGKGDLGQNPRNIRKLFQYLHDQYLHDNVE